MTAIVAIRDGGRVGVMSDRLCTWDEGRYGNRVPPFSKILATDQFLLGWSGSMRPLNVLRNNLAERLNGSMAHDTGAKARADGMVYRHLVPTIIKLLREHGCLAPDKEGKWENGLMSGGVLAITQGSSDPSPRLYEILDSFGVIPIDRVYHAVGSAEPLVLGALSALYLAGLFNGSIQGTSIYKDMRPRLDLVMTAVTMHSPIIQPTFDYMEVFWEKGQLKIYNTSSTEGL